MKKIIYLLIQILVFNLNTYGQNFTEYYLGEDVYLYKNALLRIDPKPTGNMSYMFYGSLNDCQTPLNNNVLYPEKEYSFNTEKSRLENRTFLVEQIVNKEGKDFSGKANRSNTPILILKDTASGEFIYFKYDSKYATSSYGFPFLTSLTLSKNYFCEKLEIKKDEFTGDITIQSPFSSSSKECIYKIISKSDTTYYLSLTATGSTLNIDSKGVIILFEDGSKLEKPNEKIDVKVGQKDFEYTCFIRVSKDELAKLCTNKISKYRLFIFDTSLSSFSGEKLRFYINCIIDK